MNFAVAGTPEEPALLPKLFRDVLVEWVATLA
jgi:hypothetical protein